MSVIEAAAAAAAACPVLLADLQLLRTGQIATYTYP